MLAIALVSGCMGIDDEFDDEFRVVPIEAGEDGVGEDEGANGDEGGDEYKGGGDDEETCEEGPALAHWPLDERVGSTAFDVADGQNHGSYVGTPTPIPGNVEAALRFDTGDYVEVPSASELDVGTGDFTLVYDIRTNQGSFDIVVDKRTEQSGAVRGFVAYLQGGRVYLQLGNGQGWTNWGSGAYVADGEWHHVVISVDRDRADGLEFFIDGQLVGSSNPTSRQGNLNTPRPLRMGRRSDSNWAGHLRGDLDEVKLYGYAAGNCAVLP